METTTKVLNATHRCDAGCGAAAQVLVKGLQGELMFCGHHFTKYEPKLSSWAYEIVWA